MKTKDLISDFDEIVIKLKMRILYLETENSELKKRIIELKKFVKEK